MFSSTVVLLLAAFVLLTQCAPIDHIPNLHNRRYLNTTSHFPVSFISSPLQSTDYFPSTSMDLTTKTSVSPSLPSAPQTNLVQAAETGIDGIVPLVSTVIFKTIPGTPLVNPAGKTIAFMSPTVIAITSVVAQTTLNPLEPSTAESSRAPSSSFSPSSTPLLSATPISSDPSKYSYSPVSSTAESSQPSTPSPGSAVTPTSSPTPLSSGSSITPSSRPSSGGSALSTPIPTSKLSDSSSFGPVPARPSASPSNAASSSSAPEPSLNDIVTHIVTLYTTVTPPPTPTPTPTPSSLISSKPSSALSAISVVTEVVTLLTTVTPTTTVTLQPSDAPGSNIINPSSTPPASTPLSSTASDAVPTVFITVTTTAIQKETEIVTVTATVRG